MAIDPEKIEVYNAVHTILIKTILVIAAVIAFFIILHHLIHADTAFQVGKFGTLEAVLAGTTYWLFQHYFPVKRASSSKKRISKNTP